MDSEEFREFGTAVVEYIANYWDTIRQRDVLPTVEPGYMQQLIPADSPVKPEHWKSVLKDVEKVIMPGVTHFQSPNFHGYPVANSFPSIAGELLSAGLGCIGFNWMTSPSCTELEVLVLNWLGKLLNIPKEFLNCSEGPGGGVIQGTGGEVIMFTLIAAREKTVNSVQLLHPSLSPAHIKPKLVAYVSDQARYSVKKAAQLASVAIKMLPTHNGKLRGKTLNEAISRDKEVGLIPCFVVATLGTFGTCTFDNLEEIGAICKDEGVWLHVDATYAGSAFACPEFRHLMKGLEFADSFHFNPHRWMLINFDCVAMWVRNARDLVDTFNVERIYLKHKHQGQAPDYCHWEVNLGRRFRALKVWFVLRLYGVEGIQKHIRSQIALAKHFQQLVRSDSRFELCAANMGVVCFRIKGEDKLTQLLLDKIMNSKKLSVCSYNLNEKFLIRFAIASRITELNDVNWSWLEIRSFAEEILNSKSNARKEIIYNIIPEKCNGRILNYEIFENGNCINE